MMNATHALQRMIDAFENAPEYIQIIGITLFFFALFLIFLRSIEKIIIEKRRKNNNKAWRKKNHIIWRKKNNVIWREQNHIIAIWRSIRSIFKKYAGHSAGILIVSAVITTQTHTRVNDILSEDSKPNHPTINEPNYISPKPNRRDKKDHITCRINRVIDGDTVKCQNNIRIRIAGIDAPELRTYIGKQARKYLRNITRRKLSCRILDKDRYGRYVAQCFNHKNEDIAAKIVEQGYARNCRGAPSYRKEQKIAQQKKRGMWKNRQNIPRKYWC